MALSPLIQHLQAEPQAALVEELQRAIGGSTDLGPCVYFAVSYERLARIAESGEILPRNVVADLGPGMEISATAVQTRRTDVFLGNGQRQLAPRQTHDCLNFFFNPHNSSIFALSRNQFLIGGEPLELAILEIPLERVSNFLDDRGGCWACTTKNIAAGGFTSGIFKQLTTDWPWDEIFDGSNDGQREQARAAEFVLWMEGGNGTASSGLPVEAISRILIGEGNSLNLLKTIPRVDFRKFPESKDYLTHELHLQDFERHQTFTLCGCLKDFTEAVEKLPIRLSIGEFAKPQIAVSRFHGIPHVSRVMLWTHYLTDWQLLFRILPRTGEFVALAREYDDLSEADLVTFRQTARTLAQDALLAAMIHDLRRNSDTEDAKHGEEAAKYFADLIAVFCGGDSVRVARIKDAVTWHCRDDEGCPDRSNPIWMILKDADALDRSRFGGPCAGNDFHGHGCNGSYPCTHLGCVYRTLRLDYERIHSRHADWPFRRNLALAAWNVAKATATSPWDFDAPIPFLVRWISLGRERVAEL